MTKTPQEGVKIVRVVNFLTSVVAFVGMLLPWLNVGGQRLNFFQIIYKSISVTNSFQDVLKWLNPTYSANLLTFFLLFAAIFMIIAGASWGILAHRSGPLIGLLGVFLFIMLVWYAYGQNFVSLFQFGIGVTALSYLIGLLFGGGEKL